MQEIKYGLEPIWLLCHNGDMSWEVEYTDEFGSWWTSLSEDEQDSINFGVRLLQERGPNLRRPFADTISGSSYPNMKELRCQHEGRPYRVLYAFDPRRTGILLIGGDKTGNPNWYQEYVPRADAIYAQHLKEIEKDPIC
jgi:hypothetical protein